MIRLCGLAIAAAFSYLILNEFGSRIARIVVSVAFMIIFGAAVSSFASVSDSLFQMLSENGLSEYASLLVRAIGIVFASEAATETCRSLGAEACAVGIDFACRTELLVLVLPLFKRLFSLAASLL